jgi:hypothetical protein
MTVLFLAVAFASVIAGMSWWAGAGLLESATALAMVYGAGYVTGALLAPPATDRRSLSLAIVRLVAGLLLTAIVFLFSLLLSLPWFAGPVAAFALAVIVHGRAALAPPQVQLSFRWDGVAAGLAAALALGPFVMSAMLMAPGEYPPVFFNVDTPYFLEKTHALVAGDIFPPESLSVEGGRRPYHFGVHALSAVLSRGSGMVPHHSVFLVVVPLIAIGTVAAAVLLARAIAPTVPLALTAPLLLIVVPTFWYDFWSNVWPPIAEAVTSASTDPLRAVLVNVEIWNITTNIHNRAGYFLTLASLATMASRLGTAGSPPAGWPLPVFLMGSAVMFKSPAGLAMTAGFAFVQAVQAVRQRSLRPLIPAMATVGTFGLLYVAFWVLPPGPEELKTVFSPMFYFEYLRGHRVLSGFVADLLWLVLPALLVLPVRAAAPEPRNIQLLLFALVPLILVNTMRTVDMRADLGVSSMNAEDWRNLMFPVPILLHAFALSVVGQRWVRLGRRTRVMVAVTIAFTVVPTAIVAARYMQILAVVPHNGHEFVANRPLAEALAAIPITGTLIVTNDLRYPADGFSRENRQMQIPALFGHQAFAVNYFYEAYPFSPQRRQLQKLLESESWTPAIEEAARTYGWTHLLIRHDFVHPEPIPLEHVFDNGVYAVYRFSQS